MALKSLSELDDYQLANKDQDCRGWDVVNASGIQIGKVRELLVDTESERVTALDPHRQAGSRGVAARVTTLVVDSAQHSDVDVEKGQGGARQPVIVATLKSDR